LIRLQGKWELIISLQYLGYLQSDFITVLLSSNENKPFLAVNVLFTEKSLLSKKK